MARWFDCFLDGEAGVSGSESGDGMFCQFVGVVEAYDFNRS